MGARNPLCDGIDRQALAPNSDMVVLDYGCGVGRLAKAMIEAKGCAVIGLDISARMRTLAQDYVASDRLSPCRSPV